MNVHTSRNTPLINPALFALPVQRRAVWADRAGHMVAGNVAVVPQKSSVNWEAYVVDNETMQAISDYPAEKDTNVFAVSNGNRPNDAIVQMYLAKISSSVSEEQYKRLMENITNQNWSVANIIHSTNPLNT